MLFSSSKTAIISFQELLEDYRIVKVDSANVRYHLMGYNVNVASVFDICALPILSGCNPGTLNWMCKEYLKIELDDNKSEMACRWQSGTLRKNKIDFAVTNVSVCLELFKFFVKKLRPDEEHLHAETLQLLIEQYGNEFIYTPLEEVKMETCKKRETTFVQSENPNLLKLLEELKCGDYKFVGFDCNVDILSIKRDTKMAILNLSSCDDTCVTIRLSDVVSSVPIELKVN